MDKSAEFLIALFLLLRNGLGGETLLQFPLLWVL